MPTSNLALAPWIINLVEQVPAARNILDVGPGYGKYGVLLREYLNVKPRRLDAVEAWSPYVTEMMRHVYDHVHVGRVEMMDQHVLDTYNMILMVDVLEHLDKAVAWDLIKNRMHHAWVVICTPRDWFEQGADLPWTERHRSHFTADEFDAFNRTQQCAVIHGGILVQIAPAHVPEGVPV